MELEVQEIDGGKELWKEKGRHLGGWQGCQTRMQAWPLWRRKRRMAESQIAMHFKGRFGQANELPLSQCHPSEESFILLESPALVSQLTPAFVWKHPMESAAWGWRWWWVRVQTAGSRQLRFLQQEVWVAHFHGLSSKCHITYCISGQGCPVDKGEK